MFARIGASVATLAFVAAAWAPTPGHVRDVPRVEHAIDWPRGAVLLSIDASGRTRRNGRSTAVDTMLETERLWELRKGAVLIEASAQLRVRDLLMLLEGLMRGGRVNLALVVESRGHRRCVPMPVLLDHGGCMVGGEHVSWHDRVPGGRLWIHGAVRGDRRFGATAAYVRQCLAEEYALFEDDPPPIRRHYGDAFAGEHPPFGSWTRDQMSAFWRRQDVQSLDPRFVLEVRHDDSVADLVATMSLLRSVAGIRYVIEIPGRGR